MGVGWGTPSRLSRRTGLARTAGLARGRGLQRTPMKAARPKPAVDRETKAALAVRSGGVCEARLEMCTGRASDAAHRIGTGAGGRHGAAAVENDRLANVLHLCRPCHRWCHDNPAAAKALGLMLANGCDPARERVAYRHMWALLDNQGGIQWIGLGAMA